LPGSSFVGNHGIYKLLNEPYRNDLSPQPKPNRVADKDQWLGDSAENYRNKLDFSFVNNLMFHG
jgi:hypothetical protein